MAEDAPPDRRKKFNPAECTSPWDTFKMLKRSVFPTEYLSRFPTLHGSPDPQAIKIMEYLATVRQVEPTVVFDYQVRFWEFARTPTMIFPFTDDSGVIQVLRARTLSKDLFTISSKVLRMDEGAQLPTLKTAGPWFGLNRVNPADPVVIVEGEIDCLRLATLGWTNVVAVGTSHVTEIQYRRIMNREVLLGLDSDLPGRRATVKVKREFLRRGHIVKVLDWSVVGCKDPGELPDRYALNTVHKRAVRFLP